MKKLALGIVIISSTLVSGCHLPPASRFGGTIGRYGDSDDFKTIQDYTECEQFTSPRSPEGGRVEVYHPEPYENAFAICMKNRGHHPRW